MTGETVSSGDEGITVTAVASAGSTLTIDIDGELDLSAGSHWDAVVPRLLDLGPLAVDVDLIDTSFIDSSGLGLLVKLREWANANGARLRLINVPRNVMRVLDFSGVTALFEVSAAELEPD